MDNTLTMESLYRRSGSKCVVVGDGCVGKTCLLMSYVHNEFPETHIPTVFEMHVATVQVDMRPHQLGLFDTAGQEEFDRLRVLAYPDADIFLVCFAVDSPDSMKNVKDVWVTEIRREVGENAKILIVGLKTDLRDNEDTKYELSKRQQAPVSYKEGKELAKSVDADGYLECSAFTQHGLGTVFEQAVRHILRRKPEKRMPTGVRRLLCCYACR